MMDVFDLTIG
jgi:hypothetical protein